MPIFVILISLTIFLSDGSPISFNFESIGRDGKTFKLINFRPNNQIDTAKPSLSDLAQINGRDTLRRQKNVLGALL